MSLAERTRLASCLGLLALVTAGSTAFAQTAAPEAPAPAAQPAAPAPAAQPAAPAPAALPVAVAAVPAEQAEAAPLPEVAQDKFAMGIFFNPAAILLGYYGLELDFSPMHLFSINVKGEYYYRNSGGIKGQAYGAEGGVQFFLTGQKPMHGAYVYPRFAYAKANLEAQGINGKITGEGSLIGIGVTAGYQWNWQPFSLRLGAGIIDYIGDVKATDGVETVQLALKGVRPVIDLTLGFVF
jgi:hypothetical protein